MRIAIVRLSALGDIIVSAVFLPYLKRLYPEAEIHWFVDEIFGEILDNSPFIDSLHKLPFKKIFKSANPYKIFKLYKHLRSYEKFDKVIDLQGLIKSSLIGSMLQKDKFIGFDKNSIREKIASFFYDEVVNIPYEEHILKRNATLICASKHMPLESLKDSLKDRRKAFGYSLKAQEKIHHLFLDSPKPIILFVLEASIENKTYPVEKFAELAGRISDLDVKIALLWHKDFSKAQVLCEKIKSKAMILPSLDLDELKALLDRVDLTIGGDTGVTHLAWAMQKPSITLYGNTPLERFCLNDDKNISLSGNKNAKYDKNDFSIRLISPQAIVEAIRKIL